MKWGKISSACLQAPQMSSAEHWRTSVWDIVCTMVPCVKVGVVEERSWEIGTEMSWENSDKCHNNDGLQREGAARMDLERPENTLRKLFTAFVFYKPFGQIRDDQQGGENLHSRVKSKNKACDQKVKSAKRKEKKHMVLWSLEGGLSWKVCRFDADPSGLWESVLGQPLVDPGRFVYSLVRPWSIWIVW